MEDESVSVGANSSYIVNGNGVMDLNDDEGTNAPCLKANESPSERTYETLESTNNINSDICESPNHACFDDHHLNEKSNQHQVQESLTVLSKNDVEKKSDLDSTENSDDDDDDNKEEDFCDMSDLAYITKIVLKNQSFEPSKNKRRVSPFSSDDECDNGNDVVSKASQLLGRRLVSYDSDTGESEESCDSESSSSASSTTSSSERSVTINPYLKTHC